MLPQSPSQIFKAAFRGHEEDETYRCLSTFNFGNYAEATRNAFGNLEVLNDETLGPQQNKSFTTAKNTAIILIPLVGTLACKDDSGNENTIHTEELLHMAAASGTEFRLQNLYENELINYLQIRFKRNEESNPSFEKKEFDFSKREGLFPILSTKDDTISIGIFNARSEGIYKTTGGQRGVFAFVINGAFEFQNRLLETRDGLSLWQTETIEFEALSQNAILLVIETSLKS